MQFQNVTPLKAGWTLGFEPDGRELLVVAVKGTFTIPTVDEEATFAPEQNPLTMADEFSGEPGMSAPLRETDFSHRKPMCDVLLNGTAHAPRGRAVERVTVGLRVASLVKTFDVVGNRTWTRTPVGMIPSRSDSFERAPISYDYAFGGSQKDRKDPSKVMTFERNPVGRGFGRDTRELAGSSLPHTEESSRPVADPTEAYAPMSFGPVGRNWWPRRRHAGTYDSEWLERSAPFWPPDFDYLYFQSAPEDQQLRSLKAGDPVILQNLTPDGFRQFRVPAVPVPVLFVPHRGTDRTIDAVMDTLLLEPDFDRFTITWRASLALRKDCFELKETIVGEMSPAWHRARRTAHKRYFAGLDALAAAKRGRTAR